MIIENVFYAVGVVFAVLAKSNWAFAAIVCGFISGGVAMNRKMAAKEEARIRPRILK